MKRKWNFNKKEIINLYQKGLSTIKIAKCFGCSDETIGRRLREYGIKSKDKKLPINKKKIVKL